jgi:hypothetical protein
MLRGLREGRLSLADVDLDTGRPPVRGINPLADETYAKLLEKLAKEETPASLAVRRALDRHFERSDRSTRSSD